MGGSGGVIIVNHAKQALSDPLVHGQLPIRTRAMIDPILAKDVSLWTLRDKKDIAAAFTWGMCNIV